MGNSKNLFRYSLEALIRKREWEAEQLRIEQSQIRQVIERHMKEIGTLRSHIAHTEDEIRLMQADSLAIHPEQVSSAAMFLRAQHRTLNAMDEELKRIELLADQVSVRLRDTLQSLKSVNKHKQRQLSQYQVERNRDELGEQDELWLLKQKAVPE